MKRIVQMQATSAQRADDDPNARLDRDWKRTIERDDRRDAVQLAQRLQALIGESQALTDKRLRERKVIVEDDKRYWELYSEIKQAQGEAQAVLGPSWYAQLRQVGFK